MKKSREAPRHSKNGSISENGIFGLAMDLRDGHPHPEDARAALLSVQRRLVARQQLSRYQALYLKRAFSRYVSGEIKTLDQAFGLERAKAGRPVAPLERQIEIATEVLRHLLNGESLDVAAERAKRICGISETQARKYWAANKLSAIVAIRAKRPVDRYPWTPEETKRLAVIAERMNREIRSLLQTDASDANRSRSHEPEYVGPWTRVSRGHQTAKNAPENKT